MRHEHVKFFLKHSELVASIVRPMLHLAFPKAAAKYQKIYNAASTFKEDPGPWMGRVVVWKLQVDMHCDGLDGGPTLSFCTGKFTGGHLYLPDLNLKFL